MVTVTPRGVTEGETPFFPTLSVVCFHMLRTKLPGFVKFDVICLACSFTLSSCIISLNSVLSVLLFSEKMIDQLVVVIVITLNKHLIYFTIETFAKMK